MYYPVNYYAGNLLLHNVPTGFDGYLYSGSLEHLTAHNLNLLANGSAYYGASSLAVKNSVLASVTNLAGSGVTVSGSYNGFWTSPMFGNPAWTNTADPFRSVGGGAHYLAAGCSFFDKGTNGINANLLNDLKRRTTYSPLVRTNPFALDLALGPTARRDSDGQLDLGWHYEPLDYAVSNLAVHGATLTLTNGVVLSAFGNNGLVLKPGSRLVSEGSPGQPNRLTRYNTVQEQATNWGGGTPPNMLLVNPYNTNGVRPTAELRFTCLDLLARSGYHLYTDNTSWRFGLLSLRDCQLGNGVVYFNGQTNEVVSLNNNLFERSVVEFTTPGQVSAYHNLLRLCDALVEPPATDSPWLFKDNAFDECSLAQGDDVTNANNAYVRGTPRLTPTNASDQVLSNFTYASGALGKYYHSSTNLLNAGSRSAAAAGLYHYTVRTSNLKEGNDTPATVDIGFHYVACANGLPVDTDGDGLPDWYEDVNGNGNGADDATDWTNAHTAGNSYNDLQKLELTGNFLVNDPAQDYGEEKNTQWQPGVVALGDTVVVGYWDSNGGVYGLGSYANSPKPVHMVAYSVSIDGGRTFADMGMLPLPAGAQHSDAGDPVLALDRASGVIYYAGTPELAPGNTRLNGVPLWKSLDKGASFIPCPTVREDILEADYPWIAVDDWPGTGQHDVYVVVRETTAPLPFLQHLTVSTNGSGGDWSAPQTIGDGYSQMPQVVVGTDHVAYLAWFQEVAYGGSNLPVSLQIWAVANRGATVVLTNRISALTTSNTPMALLRSNATPDTNDYFNAYNYLALAVNPDTNGTNRAKHLYGAYADQVTNSSDRADIYFLRSTDGGANWTSPMRVNKDSTTNDQWMPAIAVRPDGNMLFIGWHDRRNDTNNSLIDVYGRWATIAPDGSVTFTNEFRITAQSFPPAFSGSDTNNLADGHYDPVWAPAGVNLQWCYDWWDDDERTGVGCCHLAGEHIGACADMSYAYLVWSDNRSGSQATLYPGRKQGDIRLARLPWPP
jgi:hypothetical protein